MRALLRTACGSFRLVEVEGRKPDYKIPLPNVFDAAAELAKDPEWVPPPPSARIFVLTGDIPVYDEKIA